MSAENSCEDGIRESGQGAVNGGGRVVSSPRCGQLGSALVQAEEGCPQENKQRLLPRDQGMAGGRGGSCTGERRPGSRCLAEAGPGEAGPPTRAGRPCDSLRACLAPPGWSYFGIRERNKGSWRGHCPHAERLG